jgi:plasmid maintenance system antidote protein VapI
MKRTTKREATVTETLRQMIHDSGLSLYRVGKDAGVPYATLFRFMNEERSITAKTLDKLCASLGLVLAKK